MHTNAQTNSHTIEALGEATVSATPDRAVITLGAVTESPDLQTAQNNNAAAVTGIVQAMRQLNIPPERIRTSDFRIEPQYDYKDGAQVFRGYKVTHLLDITTDRVEQTGILVDAAVAQGANTVSGIQFTTSQQDFHENQALSLAVQNARIKAETIARTLGVKLAAVPQQVQELSHSGAPVPRMALMAAGSAPTPIQPGQLTFSASVRVWYGMN